MINPTNAFSPFINGGGLQIKVSPGVLQAQGISYTFGETTVVLEADSTNYVYLDTSLQEILVNTTGFPAAAYSIATVVTLSDRVSTLTDDRADVWAGSFLITTESIDITNTDQEQSLSPAIEPIATMHLFLLYADSRLDGANTDILDITLGFIDLAGNVQSVINKIAGNTGGATDVIVASGIPFFPDIDNPVTVTAVFEGGSTPFHYDMSVRIITVPVF